MNILHINYSDLEGGASRAAYRIHRSLVENQDLENIISEMRVVNKLSDDNSVFTIKTKINPKLRYKIVSLLNKIWMLNFKTINKSIHSPAIIKTRFGKNLKSNSSYNKKNLIVHLHWLGNLMSIEEIGNLQKPIVWTLHDQWPFCGAEHYTFPDQDSDFERFISGYLISNRPSYEKGLDINRLTWERKKKSWNNLMNIVCPSNWMANCARKSELMKNWRIKVIPNPIDTGFWKPINKSKCRKELNLPLKKIIIIFGAIGGLKDIRKGADLLKNALIILKKDFMKESAKDIQLIVFGQSSSHKKLDYGFPINFFGIINDDNKLRKLYSAADLVVVPSRKECFGQVATEAHACGTPVAAFNSTGLSEIIEHKVTGHFANPFDPYSLAYSINWIIENKSRLKLLGKSARKRSIAIWDHKIISQKYHDLYNEILSN